VIGDAWSNCWLSRCLWSNPCFAHLLTPGFWLLAPLFFALFVPLADVAKGGDGAKSAFCGYSRLTLALGRSDHSCSFPPFTSRTVLLIYSRATDSLFSSPRAKSSLLASFAEM